MKKSIILIVLIISIGCTQDATKLIKKYEKLHNLHDVEGTMLLYHDKIQFELVGVWIKSGKTEIRRLEQYDSVLNSNLKFESFRVKGDSVLSKIIERNDWFKAVGLDQIVHDSAHFIIKDGRIIKIVAYPSEGTGREISAKLDSLFTWSNLTKDSTIYDLIKDGEFIYSAESAKKWLTILNKWNKDKN